MYHTEGYIDKESVDSSAHMVSLAGKIQNRDVLVWAVWKESDRARQYQGRLEQWLTGELGAVDLITQERINREMLRICTALKCRLYLYYDQKLYRAGEQAGKEEYCIGSNLGACVHKGEKPGDIRGGQKNLCVHGEQKPLQEEKKNLGGCFDGEAEELDPALLGNIWQKNIMDCVMEDSLSYAYFMLWEVR